jgi:phosphatidylglycerol:prolipoprotein diacylglycerol transferase
LHPLFLRIGNFQILGFHIGEFGIGTYGVMLALGLLAGMAAVLYRARREGVPSQLVLDLVFYAVLGGIVGGRLAYIVVYPRVFAADPWGVLFSRSGFVFLGSIAGAIPLAGWGIWRHRLAFWRLADVLITGVPLGHAFGRIGCFTAGCCFGKTIPQGSPLGWMGLHFPPGIAVGSELLGGQAYSEQMAQGLIPQTATCSLGVWPTELMESVGNLLIFLALMWTWRRRRFAGQIFLVYLTLYSVVRFLLEFLRGDSDRGFVGPLSTSQILGLLALVAVMALWRRLSRRGLGGPAVPVDVVAAYSLEAAKTETPKAATPPRNGRPRRKR